MIDTHTHLNFKAFADDWQSVVEESVKAGVKRMIVVGTDVQTSKKAVEMVESHSALYAAVGIHPHHVRGVMEEILRLPDSSPLARRAQDDKLALASLASLSNVLSMVRNLASHPKVVAIGEIGLDYHEYRNSKYEPRNSPEEIEILKQLQKKLLLEQIKLAQEVDKPLILHSREVGDEVLEVIASSLSSEIASSPSTSLGIARNVGVKGVFHCFDGSKKYLKKILDAGFFVSFTGNITFIPDRMDVATLVPLDRLLLETDCPYMTPEPIRGQRNLPQHVRLIAQAHAQARGIRLETVIEQTSKNATRLFTAIT